MKVIVFATFVLVSSCFGSELASAEETRTLLFEDHFDRNESQEAKEEIGNGWASNSEKRANGNKQVDLRDGAMYIYFHESADHAVSVTHPAEFRDGLVSLRFMLEGDRDSLGLNFADLKFKEVHAGHLCVAKISTQYVQIDDLKTGGMAAKFYELKKAKKLTPAMKAELKSKTKRFPNELETGKWYDLSVRIEGETMTVSIDGAEVGAFSSEGIAHPTKRLLRLAVPKNAVVDDVMIYSLSK
ncbi:LamG domain-containing protein [Aporhodopirellula aestuarii]|uniref:LamG domain-containing protein n=1 Tax=Aporhodopirellula aestuarii TaxID=2950107 RepID=A0ABT0U8U1_9BACT|nr:LamG domain-containing protein [Aporhodopirellula aestuarii]MCM2373232.1 LamG domain-containing protein [Aporhodopirellula aestuarii]